MLRVRFCGLNAQNSTKYIDVTNEACTSLPRQLAGLSELASLVLKSNSLSKVATQVGELRRLYWLDLDSNRLAEVPTQLGQLSALYWLDLHSNKLKAVPTQFGKLKALYKLGLDSNEIRAAPTELGELTALAWLDLRLNKLDSVPSQLGRLTELYRMGLDSNDLSVMPTQLGEMRALSSLHLGLNQLEAIPTQIGQLSFLALLDLRNNSLAAVPTELGNLTLLSSLSLESNSLAALPTQLGEVTTLASLHAGGNELVELPTQLGRISTLSWLDLHSNYLVAVPTEIGLLSELVWLSLDANNLTLLPTELGQVTALPRLRLSLNQLKSLPTELGMLTALGWLEVESNQLSSLPPYLGKLTALTRLDLGSNYLTELPTEFGELTKLARLDLRNNRLPMVPTQFGMLERLSSLYLDSNGLALMPTQLGRLTNLEIDVNPPVNLGVEAVGSHSIELSWLPPHRLPREMELRHYVIEIDLAGSSDTPVYVVSANKQKTIRLNELFLNDDIPMRMASVRVRAMVLNEDLDRYYTLWSKPLIVRTCPSYMHRRQTFEQCYAISGYYRRENGLAQSCTDLERVLPLGAINSDLCFVEEGTTVEDLPVSRYFWRASVSSEDIRMCPNTHFCTHQNASNLFTPNRYCAEYHTGTYCAACIEDYVIGVEGCEYCTQKMKDSRELLGLVCCALVLVVLFLYVYVLKQAGVFSKICCSVKRKPRRPGKQVKWGMGFKRCLKVIAPGTKVRILFGYFQVLSSYQRTFMRQSLLGSSNLLGMVTFVSNFDVFWLVSSASFRCTYDFSAYDVLLFVTLGPVALTALLFATTTSTVRCLMPSGLGSVIRQLISALLLLLFVVYPYVSQTILSTFWCEDFPDADRAANLTTSALRADYRLTCERDLDKSRLLFEVYAGIMVAVYPVGVVALYCWILYRYKAKIASFYKVGSVDKKENIIEVSFLIQPYRINRYWYEAYELIRKLIQSSFVGFLIGLRIHDQYPEFLALISQNLTILFTVNLALLRPYKRHSDMGFALISLLLLLPAAQYSLLDPYSRDEGIERYGIEALIITELVLFALFAVIDLTYSGARSGCIKVDDTKGSENSSSNRGYNVGKVRDQNPDSVREMNQVIEVSEEPAQLGDSEKQFFELRVRAIHRS